MFGFELPPAGVTATFAREASTLRVQATPISGGLPSRTAKSATSRVAPESPLAQLGITRVVWPAAAMAAVRAELERLPPLRSGWGVGATFLPVLVEPPPGTEHLDWLAFPEVLPPLGERRRRLVPVLHRILASPPREWPVYLPPPTVAGAGRPAVDLAYELTRTWLLEREPGSPSAPVALDSADLVIAADDDYSIVEALAARPRLVVLGYEPLHHEHRPGTAPPMLPPARATLRPPTGTALLHIPAPRLDLTLLGQLAEELAHDQPLHAAIASLAARAGEAGFRLVSDAATLDTFRLADGYAEIVRQARRLGTTFVPPVAGPHETVATPTGWADDVEQVIDACRNLIPSFDAETHGYTSLRRATGPLDQARAAAASATRWVDDATATRGLELEPPARAVDVALERQFISRLTPDPFVQRHETLQASAPYDVVLTIGSRWSRTLVEGEVPSIDRLLPEPHGQGTSLDVGLYSKDFTFTGTGVVPLLLPVEGPSDDVRFRVLAPPTTGIARLRVAIYHRDHLVQSFLLSAIVTRRERRRAQRPATRVVLEHGSSAGFTNVGELPPRRLSISLNDDGDGTHELGLKGGAGQVTVRVNAEQTKELADRFRATLQLGLADPDDAVRTLAHVGQDLRSILVRMLDPAIDARLHTLATSEGEVVQIVRFDDNATLPWSVLYDYPLPIEVVGSPAPVCWGYDGASQPCDHGPGSAGAYCVRGFWGYRHVLEELYHRPAVRDRVTTVPMTPPDPAFAVSVGLVDPDRPQQRDQFLDDLPARLPAAVGPAGCRILDATVDVEDLLWGGARRPPVLVIVGHHESSATPGRPAGERITAGFRGGWLVLQTLRNRMQYPERNRWRDDPLPIVVLLSCESAAPELADPVGFGTAFHTLGATAIIGTECSVATAQVVRFAETVLPALADHTSVGEAMRLFRRNELSARRNVRGFAYNLMGDADVALG